MLESDLQKMCVTWMRTQHKKILFYAVPNEGKRSFALANHMKAMGLTSGIPDLVIPHPRGKHHGLYVELKAGKNKLTTNQVIVGDILKTEGYVVEVVYSFEEFQDVIKSYLRIK